MRIAILSDIHGNLAALEAVERDLLARGAEVVVNLGDSLSGPLLPRETAEFLMARDWVHLAGNHERQLMAPPGEQQGASDAFARARLEERHFAWMASLPTARELEGGVFLCHGTPRRDDEHLLASVHAAGLVEASGDEVEARLEGVAAAVVACGHTHLPRCRRTARGQLILNPGSVGLQAYLDAAPHPYAVENGSPEARYAVLERRAGPWSAELIKVPYEVEPMAGLARARGFGTWEEALRTGFLPPAARPAAPPGVQP